MARSQLSVIKKDVTSDSGRVLFSFIQGEQLEYPVTLQFLPFVLTGYTFEAVVIEALNVSGQLSAPKAVHPNPVQTTVTVRVPTYRGAWDAGGAYNKGDVILYGTVYYKLLSGVSYTSSTLPNADVLWAATTPNTVYLQFLSSLGSTWHVAPAANSSVYGFFELRVTAPSGPPLQRTWKPVRGIIELLFSPTDLVP